MLKVLDQLYAPPFELNWRVALKRLPVAQPLKLIVTLPDLELPAPILPSTSGKAAGLVITGAQAEPAVWVRLNPSIRADVAVLRPLALVSVKVQTLAAIEPDLPVMLALSSGGRTILALTVIGPFMVTVVAALDEDATGPVQELNR